jgi:hypothetical protein
MTITLEDIRSGSVPISDLRSFIIGFNGVDENTMPDEACEAIDLSRAVMLAPQAGSPAATIIRAFGQDMSYAPIVTAHGARIASVAYARRVYRTQAGGVGFYSQIAFSYDDGIEQSFYTDQGAGVTLITDDRGEAAFYAPITAFDCREGRRRAKVAGFSIGFLPYVEQIEERHLPLLSGYVDASAVAAVLRPAGRNFDAGTAPVPHRPDLAKLYAAPPSPGGRARLGRRI